MLLFDEQGSELTGFPRRTFRFVSIAVSFTLAFIFIGGLFLAYSQGVKTAQWSESQQYAQELPPETQEVAPQGPPPAQADGEAATPTTQPTPSVTASPTVVQPAPFVPTRITIPTTDSIKHEVNTIVLPKPTEVRYSKWHKKDLPGFGVPERGDVNPATKKRVNPMQVVVWWSDGPKINEVRKDGMLAILLGHTQIDGTGVFNDLGKLEVHKDKIVLTGENSSRAVMTPYKVVPGIDKEDENALLQVLNNPPPGATAALVTCSGMVKEFESGRSQDQNTVVFLGPQLPKRVDRGTQ